MGSGTAAGRLDDLVLELDLVVYALERPPPEDGEEVRAERERLRRDLEKIRDALRDVQRDL